MSSISDAPLMSSDFGIQHLVMPFEGNQPGPSHMGIGNICFKNKNKGKDNCMLNNTKCLIPYYVSESPSATPPAADATDLLRLLTDGNGYGSSDSPKAHLERLLSGAMDVSHEQFPLGIDIGTFGMAMDIPMQYGDMGGMVALRNSSKTLKCPKCNWHYKYQETLEIHMKEKHSDGDVRCVFCVENRVHPKLARGESYSCGYKPYRCELCKYSTTTKGNLSIHMQSDKHLHAMQELPTSIASLACPPSSARSPVQDGDKTFVCVVCGCFSSDSLQEMMQHADKDRSRPTHGDISMNNGVFRCHLCPYNTNLKANFQLHTRTDKHLQRVQMVNHIREGSTTSSALCRLGNAKSVFQVLCRPCQEILPSASSLREHFESVSHRTNLRQPITHYQCSVCTFETPHKSEAIAHMTCHEPSTWPQNTVVNPFSLNCPSVLGSQILFYDDEFSREVPDNGIMSLKVTHHLLMIIVKVVSFAFSLLQLCIDFDVITMEEDAAYACASCGFATREATTLEEHARSHEEGEQCPLCTDRTLKLTEHLIQVCQKSSYLNKISSKEWYINSNHFYTKILGAQNCRECSRKASFCTSTGIS
uniref:C2H2-type domain-containing protein n=1 Tax=Heterorhabditis bacteriophora TaxID=37862 RepID=A0A1I7XED0_HETBA